MAINWRLKTYLATEHGIFSITVLQKKIVKATGIIISIPTLCNYINKKPQKLPLKTIELICSTLNCNLSDFCNVGPCGTSKPDKTKKLSYKNTPNSKRAVTCFPSPKDYM
jgi:DNA-binding Xre family transcriptional regulator